MATMCVYFFGLSERFSYVETDIVLITIGITAGVCFAISIFAVQTKVSFSRIVHGQSFSREIF